MSALDGMDAPAPEQGEPVSGDTPVQETPAVDTASQNASDAIQQMITMTQAEYDAALAERDRVAQSRFDKRFDAEQKKARQEIEALKNQVNPQPAMSPAQTQMAQTMAASGMTDDEIDKAFKEGRGVQVLEQIASKAAERVFQSQTSAMQQEQMREKMFNDYGASLDRMKAEQGFGDADMQRIVDTSIRYYETFGHLPDPNLAAFEALGVPLNSILSNVVKARRAPAPAPTKPAPSLVGSPTGSAISEVKQGESIYRPNAFRELM